MGIYDRDYMSEGKYGKGMASWSMVTWLLIANIVAFLVQHLILNYTSGAAISLSRGTGIQVWRFFTYQFFHDNPFHLIFNMLWLFFLGRPLEQQIGSINLLMLYLIGGILGGLVHIGFSASPVIGASGSTLAIAIALIRLHPEQSISLLFLPIQFKMKYLGWFLIGMNVLGFLTSLGPASSGTNNTSYSAHLGGITAGWLFIQFLYPILQRKQMLANGNINLREQGSKIKQAAKKRKQEKKQKDTAYLNTKVDDILEKISEQGMQSLTAEEKKILEQSSEQLSKKLDGK